MKINLLVILLIFSSVLTAQFTGGEGDGYASAQQTVISTSLENEQNNFIFYPTIIRKGESLYVEEKTVNLIILSDVIGNQYFINKDDSGMFYIPSDLSNGKYTIQAITTDRYYVASMVIYD